MRKMGAWLYKNRSIIVWCVLAVCVLAYIFGNSLQDGAASSSRSEAVAREIKPILDPQNRVPESDFHTFTRKLAHWTEFCVLGICLGGLACAIRAARGRCSVFMPLFGTLLAAVTDEYIQNFTGRTSMVRDVLIDFGGAFVGVLLICAAAAVWRRVRK